jgi:hypothetical protein
VTPSEQLESRKQVPEWPADCRNCGHEAELHDAGAEDFFCVCSECDCCDYEPMDREDALERENLI